MTLLSLLPRRFALALCAVLVVAGFAASSALAITPLFQEDFEGIPKFTSPTYALPDAWSPNPPPGWEVGSVIPSGGIPEWRGWTFWRKSFWQAIGGGPRDAFEQGSGTIAIADNDLWNDDNNPAGRGYYNTFLQTPPIDLGKRRRGEDRLVLAFDTSWFARECCDDAQGNPPLALRNNQTGVVRARMPDGTAIDLLRWESAPFRDGQGRPTDQPNDPTGQPNTPNPFARPLVANERVYVDLSQFFPPQAFASLTESLSSASGEAEAIKIEFAMEDAGDDGYWAVDNLEMASFPGVIAGDLFIDGVLDAKDIDEFALGLLDEPEYTAKWFGETPGARGSDDESFDYDDIPWFLGVMEDAGTVTSPAVALAAALNGIPEPSTALLMGIALIATAGRARAPQ